MSQTKFNYFVQLMTQEVAVKVLDLIKNPPEYSPYQSLKDLLLRMFALINYACAEVIARDMQPSTFVSQMLVLLPDGHKLCFFLRAAFLKKLPVNARIHLVHNRTSDPLTFAFHADKIFQSLFLPPLP